MKSLAIKEFAEVITGGTPSTSIAEYWNGDIPWLNSGELNKGIIYEASNFITKKGLVKSNAKLMPIDTVLIALTGTTTGATALLKIEASANQSVTGILPSTMHVPKYLYFYLKSIRKEIMEKSYGGAQKHISQQFVKNIQVPLPSIEEQQRIVKILDLSQSLIEKRKQAISHLDDYIKAVFLDMFGDPVSNPKGWALVKFTDVLVLSRGFDLPKQSRVAGGYPLVASNGIVDRVSESKISAPGIVTGRSGTLGSVQLIEEDYWPLNTTLYSQKLHGNNPVYLKFFLEFFDLKRFTRGAGVPTLNRNLFHSELIQKVPIDLQNKFETIYRKSTALQQKMQSQLKELEDNFQAQLQRAFKKR